MLDSNSSQKKYMLRALDLARAHNPFPNPAVGAVIVKDGRIVAEAAHRKAGEEHAEAAAIRLAGAEAAGAELYVTLEPCCHSGGNKRRPPCTKTVIESGINRVMAASVDPNPLVSGRGFAELRAAGIEVEYGLLSETEALMNRAYRRHQYSGLPWVHMKQAVSLDGYISRDGAERTVISCGKALERVHGLRAAHQAILVGGATAITDRPALTLRYGYESRRANPARIIVEGSAAVPPDNPVFDAGSARVYLFTGKTDSKRLRMISARGVKVTALGRRPDLTEVLRQIGALGIISVLVEAGGRLASALQDADLVDELSLFYSPELFGRGVPMAEGGAFRLDESEWKSSEPEMIGRDVLLNWIRRREDVRCLRD